MSEDSHNEVAEDGDQIPPMFRSPSVQILHLYIFVWALSSVVAAGLSPRLIDALPVVGSIPTVASALYMLTGGVVLLGARLLRSPCLLLLVMFWAIVMMVGSFTTAVEWSVGYDSGLAAISMTVAHLLLVVALLHNAAVFIGPPRSLFSDF
jgi:hypothetical protein